MWRNIKITHEFFLILTLLFLAFLLRLYDLDLRPLHHDESLHSFYSWVLAEGGGYSHTPMMHGPLQFQFNALIFRIFGDSEFTSRLLYASIGSIIVIMPFWLKPYMSKFSIVLASIMLTISPSLLYFSRFSRNDILMAFLIMGLIICLWKFIYEGRSKYIYLASAILALSMGTKESSFLIIAILGFYLTFVVVQKNLPPILARANTYGQNPFNGIWLIIKEVFKASRTNYNPSDFSRQTKFLIILIIVCLPQWSSLFSVLQDTAIFSWTGIILSQDYTSPNVGNPLGTIGHIVAILIFISLLILSIAIGVLSKWNIWFRAIILFYIIWISIFSNIIWIILYSIPIMNFSFDTTGKEMINLATANIGSGSWRQLSYWISQQEVARGSQPWYYYFIITPIYEYLPFIFSFFASIYYYFNRKNPFSIFLVYWVLSTFLIFIFVSEKMPWLLVNITLPMILLSSQFLGDISKKILWKDSWITEKIIFFAIFPLLLVSVFQLIISPSLLTFFVSALLSLILIGNLILGRYKATVIKMNLIPIATISVAFLLLILTIRTSLITNYVNQSIPKELIVYTQTTPELINVLSFIETTSEITNKGEMIHIVIDQTNGFTWPWIWYLRDYQNVSYPSGFKNTTQLSNNPDIVIVHENNLSDIQKLQNIATFADKIVLRHRWWFPEFDETYRDLTPQKILRILTNRQSIRSLTNYWLYRDGVEEKIGSENAFIFIPKRIYTEIPPLEIKQ